MFWPPPAVCKELGAESLPSRADSPPWALKRWWYNTSMAHTRTNAETDRYSVTVGARGRVVLPAALREQLGLKEGDRLVLTVQPDGSVKLVSLREAVRGLEGIYAHLDPGRSWSDELVQERREEARREEAG